MKIWDKCKEVLRRRKWWIALGVVFFVTELYLFVEPFSFVKEDKVFALTGEGSLELAEDDGIYGQQFVPQYDYIKSISLLFQNQGLSLQSEGVSVRIVDAEDEVLFQRDIPYTQLEYGRYTDIGTGVHLNAGEDYWLVVMCREDSLGQKAALSVCSKDYHMAENGLLTCGNEFPDLQLVTRYVYGDTIAGFKLWVLLLICVVTFVGIAFGVPKNEKVKRLVGVVLLLLAPIILGTRLELVALNQSDPLLPFAMRWNIVLMYLLEILVLLCTMSLRCSIVITNFFLMIIYTVNYYVWLYRHAPFKLSDLTAINTAVRVMGGYDFTPNPYLSFVWCVFLVFLVYGLQTGVILPLRIKGRQLVIRLVTAAFGICVAIGSGYCLLYTDFLLNHGFVEFHGFDEYMTYRYDGYLVSTCLNIKNSRIERPEGYSRAKAESILQEVSAAETGLSASNDSPHIIVIMNESFADLRTLGDLEVKEEYLPFFNSLTENTIRGYVNASVLGGGTANSEFELFTGCSMGLLPQSNYPYQQILNQSIPSMVSNLAKYGYTTYSMHPALKTNWNRDLVYQYMGFDYSLWDNDFENAESFNGFVADQATYDKVISLYENRKEDEKLFIFDLTIQNHGGYVGAHIEDPIILNAPSDEAEYYLSLIRMSDSAFEQLVTYFENQDEKVIICMFGDHHPKFANEEFYESVYANTEGQTETERLLGQYMTPFVIWANYDIEEQNDVNISLNYLGEMVLETAEIPLSPYFAFLKELRQEYPVITANGYLDITGNYSSWSGDDTEFSDYRILQYNYLFDDATVHRFE